MAGQGSITVLGVFVADTAFRADRPPVMGETILGNDFKLGPGGKGSNQAVAAAKLGGDVNFISRIGNDAFADMAEKTWADAGVKSAVIKSDENYTGAAYIFVEESSGNNAIIVCPGAANDISVEDLDAKSNIIAASRVFVTQLEQPLEAAKRGLEIAKKNDVTTILNPAPAASLDDIFFGLCDYITPNETEAEALTGIRVASLDSAKAAGAKLIEFGAKAALLTLGEQGAILVNAEGFIHVPAFNAGAVVETTGAGDAFNGGFAFGLTAGMDEEKAMRFGCATAGVSVTRAGAAPSMPNYAEVTALL